jgi:DNA-binding transcriptional LysR family regulator
LRQGQGASGREDERAMQEKLLRNFDLNLLKVFLAVWEARSLTLAGEQLGLSQPAISHTLKRLREQFDDPLFVRIGNEMSPTETAVQFYEPMQASMRIVEQILIGQTKFRPEESSRTFRIAMSDITEFYFLPDILQRILDQAPNFKIETVNLDVTTVDAALKSGKIDLAIGYIPYEGDDHLIHPLIRQRHTCIVRRDHPFRGKKLSFDDFSQLVFVDISKAAPGYSVIEQHLSNVQAVRTVATRSTHLSVLPEIVRRTDLAALFPESIVQRVAGARDFRILELPFELPEVPISIHAHKRFGADPAIVWFCEVISMVLGSPAPREDA